MSTSTIPFLPLITTISFHHLDFSLPVQFPLTNPLENSSSYLDWRWKLLPWLSLSPSSFLSFSHASFLHSLRFFLCFFIISVNWNGEENQRVLHLKHPIDVAKFHLSPWWSLYMVPIVTPFRNSTITLATQLQFLSILYRWKAKT